MTGLALHRHGRINARAGEEVAAVDWLEGVQQAARRPVGARLDGVDEHPQAQALRVWDLRHARELRRS
eukprot:4803011-Pyramimonas_sp.AAC.2